MFEKNERSGSLEEAAGQAEDVQPISSDTDQPAAAAAAAAEAEDNTAEAADAEADAAADEGAASDASQPAADAEQQPKLSSKQRRKQQRRRGKKAAKAAAAGDDAAAASRRRFNRVRIDEFPVASQLICELMALLRKELIAHPVLRDKVFQVRQLRWCFDNNTCKTPLMELRSRHCRQ
jgi:hypothetical protein